MWIPTVFGFKSILPKRQLFVKKVYEVNADQAESDDGHETSQYLPESPIEIASPHIIY